MPYFKITQLRSAIGLPLRVTGNLRALGLRRRMQTVYHEVTPDVAGQIMKVKELVAVSEVERALSKAELKEARRPDTGYWIEKRGVASAAKATATATAETAGTAEATL